jgi:hypothetical protein
MTNLNDLFKKKLAEQQFDGKEKYWAQLDKKLTAHAQEKVVVAWYKKWLLPMFAIVITGATFLMYNHYSNKGELSHHGSNLKQHTTAQEIVTNTQHDIASEAPNLNENLSSETHQLSQKSEQKSIETTKNIESSPINNGTSNADVKKQNLINKIDNSQSNSYSTNQKTGKHHHLFANNISKEPELSIADEEIINETSNNNDQSNFQNSSEKSVAFAPITNPQNYNNKGLDYSNIDFPISLLLPKNNTPFSNTQDYNAFKSQSLEVVTPKSKPIYSVSVYGGAMYSIKNLFNSGNTVEYLNRRKSEEQNIIQSNAGIDFELKQGHWTFSSGINFHQQGEKRNYSDSFKRNIPYDSLVININDQSQWLVDSTVFFTLNYNSIIVSQDTTVTYYDESSGLFYTASLPINITQSSFVDTNFYYLIDSSYQQNIDTTKTNYTLQKQQMVKDPNQPQLKGRNTFSYFEIPLLIGYEWGIKRWRVSIKGGVGFGLLTRQQSYYLSKDEAEIAPVSTNVYSKMLFNGILRAGLHYNFTPQFGLDIVPFSRININNMTNNKASFQQKYSNVGLQIGLNYKL